MHETGEVVPTRLFDHSCETDVADVGIVEAAPLWINRGWGKAHCGEGGLRSPVNIAQQALKHASGRKPSGMAEGLQHSYPPRPYRQIGHEMAQPIRRIDHSTITEHCDCRAGHLLGEARTIELIVWRNRDAIRPAALAMFNCGALPNAYGDYQWHVRFKRYGRSNRLEVAGGQAPHGQARRFSMASQIMTAMSGPPKRLISRMPVGEVTLISVR